MANTSMNIRMDSQVKKEAEKIFAEFGLNMTTAINMFLRQTIRENGIPFELKLKIPNVETIAAIKEGTEIIEKGKSRYSSAQEMFDNLGI